MKILITGANGLLGQKLVDALRIDDEVDTIATARGKNRLPSDWSGYKFETMDITSSSEIEKVLLSYQPDCVIHTAAMTQVDECELNQEECWNKNVTAVENLVQACEKIGAYLAYVSTDFIFNGSHGLLDEEAEPHTINFYGMSKLAAEKVVQRSRLKWSILRTVLVYGVVRDIRRSNIILWVKRNLEEGKEIKVVNDQWRTPTLAEDLVQGCILAAKHQAQGIYNISGKDFLTPYDIAIKTADYFKLDKLLIKDVNADTFSQPAKRPPKTGFIIEKARAELGYEPRSFDEGLDVVASQL